MLRLIAIALLFLGAPLGGRCADQVDGGQRAAYSAAVSEATIFQNRTIVNDRVIDGYRDWLAAPPTTPITISGSKTEPSEHVNERQQLYVALRAREVIQRPAHFVLRLYLHDDKGQLQLKDATLARSDNHWSIKLILRGDGVARGDILYSRHPDFRQAKAAFPELDITKPIATSYFDAYPIDVGEIKKPLVSGLRENWTEWTIPLVDQFLAKARFVDDSLQVLEELQSRFALRKDPSPEKTDSVWSAEVLEANTLERALDTLQKDRGTFQFTLQAGGNDVVGTSDFVPDVRKKISVAQANGIVAAELWLRSLKEGR